MARVLPAGLSTGDFWMQRIGRADHARMPWFRVQQHAMTRYDGLHQIFADNEDQDEVGFNKFQSAEDNLLAELQMEDWRHNPMARKKEDVSNARLMGHYLDWNASQGLYNEALEDVIQNARIRALGVMKVTWAGPHIWDVSSKLEDDDVIAHLEAMKRAWPVEQIGTPVAFAWSVDPDDFFQDAEAGRTRFARWAAQRYYVTRDTLEMWFKQSPFFKGKIEDIPDLRSALPTDRVRQRAGRHDSRNWRRGVPGRLPGGTRRGAKSVEHSGDDLIAIFEIYDREENEVLHQVLGMDEPLWRYDQDLQAEGLPFFELQFGRRAWKFYHYPDMHSYLSAQDLLDKLVSLYASHVNRFGKVIITYPKGTPPEQIQAIEEATGGTMVEYDGAIPPQPMNFGSIPADIPNMIQLSSEIIHQISGVSAPSSGLLPGTTQTATAIDTTQEGQNKRVRRQRKQIKNVMKRSARYSAQLIQELAPEEQVVRVLGPIEAPEFLTIKLEDVQGEFDYDISVGADTEANQLKEAKLADDFLNFAQANPLLDQTAVTIDWLQARGKNPERLMGQPQEEEIPPGAEGVEGEGELEGGDAGGPQVRRGNAGPAQGPVASNDQRSRAPDDPNLSRRALLGQVAGELG